MTSPLVPNRATFQIKHDGPAIVDGTMSIDDLVPVLLAVNNLIETTNRELNGSMSKVRVTVDKTTHESFGIDVGVFQTLVEGLPYIASAVVTADAIRGLLFGKGGLFELRRRARGREIEKIRDCTDGEHALVQVIGDNNQITVNNYVYKLSQNKQASRAADDMLRPLKQQGI